MKRKVKLFAIIAMLGCMLLGSISVQAAENNFIEIPQQRNEIEATESKEINTLASPSLSRCNLGIGIASNGVQITFVTTATQNANEIGVKNVVVQEKTLLGWKDIPASSYHANNTDVYSGGIVYTQAVKGKTYRVKCTHYAKFGSTELTLNNTTSELVYN